jgi:hypothetical protein
MFSMDDADWERLTVIRDFLTVSAAVIQLFCHLFSNLGIRDTTLRLRR